MKQRTKRKWLHLAQTVLKPRTEASHLLQCQYIMALKAHFPMPHGEDTFKAVWKAWKTEIIYPWIVSVCEVTVRPWVWLHIDGITEASLQRDDRNEHISFPLGAAEPERLEWIIDIYYGEVWTSTSDWFHWVSTHTPDSIAICQSWHLITLMCH